MTIRFAAFSKLVGLMVLVLSGVLTLMGIFAAADWLIYGTDVQGEQAACIAMWIAAVVGAVLGAVLWRAGRRSKAHFGQREALLLVAAGWLLGAFLCALPFFIWSHTRPQEEHPNHDFDTFSNCYFESMSGFTTTGATIVTSLDTLPRSLLLLRATTHWLGGLGIVLLFVAVLPSLGVGGRRVFRIESPGPSPEGVTPKIRDTARVLWLIYVGLTVAETVLLKLCGLTWFEAVCHTFATLATGGFSTMDSSVAGFAASSVHFVIIVFMVLAGVNFSLYFAAYQRRWRAVFTNAELRVYLALLGLGTLVITLSLLISRPAGMADAPALIVFRDALFQVVSIQTTTGFCTADFDQWPVLSKILLVALMFVGGCAGSTGGGIKVIRVMIVAKILLAEVETAFRPSVVRTLKIGSAPVEPDQKLSCIAYAVGIVVLFAAGTGALLLLEEGRIDLTTAATATAATLNNIGPGLAKVGATQNYAWFSPMSKVVMSGLMALGRLEVFAIIVLFSPRFWRGE